MVQVYWFFLARLLPLFHIPCPLSSYSFSSVFFENMVALIKNVTNKYGPTWYVHASSGFIMYLVAVNVTSAVSKPFQWDWPDQYIHFEQQMLEDLCRRVCDLVWLEVLNCLSFTGNLVLFHANLHCRVAKSMWPLLTVNVQMALIGDTHYALELVAWYREIFSTFLDRGFCLYLWFARSFQYIGIARLHRTGSEHVGPVQRLFEHLVLCRRQHAPHARFLRYKLARRMPLWKTLWFPVHCGEEPMIPRCRKFAYTVFSTQCELGTCSSQTLRREVS